jgi:excisionase family DNA binding protein
MFHPLLKIEVERPPRFASLIGVSKQSVMLWIKAGSLQAHRIGGRFFVPSTELVRLKEESTN